MALDLSPLQRFSYGLVLLSARADAGVRQALWEVLAGCDTLYWVGPLAEKPVVGTRQNTWLLECPAADRLPSLGHVFRRDAHAVHVIGPVDAPLFERLVHGALAGSVTVAELDAVGLDTLVAESTRLGVAPELLKAASLAAIDETGALRLLR